MEQKWQKCAETEINDLIDRIDRTQDYPVGTKMLQCYGKNLEYLSAIELYEFRDSLRVVDDES